MNTKNKNKKTCLCDEPTCAKCLSVNCLDDDCKVHSVGLKIRARERILINHSDIGKDKIKTLKEEILRLKKEKI